MRKKGNPRSSKWKAVQEVVHPNAAGHTRIAEAMEPLILELPEPQAWAMGWAALLTLSLRATQRRRDALWSSA